jgi:hypothetical protein
MAKDKNKHDVRTSAEQQAAILADVNERRLSLKGIADKHGVHVTTVQNIRARHGQTWPYEQRPSEMHEAMMADFASGMKTAAVARKHDSPIRIASYVKKKYAKEIAGLARGQRVGLLAHGPGAAAAEKTLVSQPQMALALPPPSTPPPSAPDESRIRTNSRAQTESELEFLRSSLKKALEERRTLRHMVEMLTEENQQLREGR